MTKFEEVNREKYEQTEEFLEKMKITVNDINSKFGSQVEGQKELEWYEASLRRLPTEEEIENIHVKIDAEHWADIDELEDWANKPEILIGGVVFDPKDKRSSVELYPENDYLKAKKIGPDAIVCGRFHNQACEQFYYEVELFRIKGDYKNFSIGFATKDFKVFNSVYTSKDCWTLRTLNGMFRHQPYKGREIKLTKHRF